MKDHPFGIVLRCFAGCELAIVKAAIRVAMQGIAPKRVIPSVKLDQTELFRIAMRTWGESTLIARTWGETYFRNRKITVPLPASLRFHPEVYHKESGLTGPAVIALVTDLADYPVAIHRTWITAGGAGKAKVDPVRQSPLFNKGREVRLGEPRDR